MGKGFVTSQEASITAGSPEFTGRIGSWRCTWRDWMPSSCKFTSFPSQFCLQSDETFEDCCCEFLKKFFLLQSNSRINLHWLVWYWLYSEGTSPGTTTKSLQACITSAGTGTYSISSSWPAPLVYWSSFVLGRTSVQSGTWWVPLALLMPCDALTVPLPFLSTPLTHLDYGNYSERQGFLPHLHVAVTWNC